MTKEFSVSREIVRFWQPKHTLRNTAIYLLLLHMDVRVKMSRTEVAWNGQFRSDRFNRKKVVHLERWTRFFETFPFGPNRSIQF